MNINYYETIYSDKIFKRIKSILGKPKTFNKASKTVKLQIFNKLERLILLSDTTNIFKDNHEIDDSVYNEFIEFEKIMIKELNKDINRKDSLELKNEISKCTIILIDIIKNYGFDINLKEDIETIVKNIPIKKLYNLMIQTSLSALSKSVYSEREYKIDIKDDEISFFTFNDILCKKLILYLTIVILDAEKSGEISDIIEKINEEYLLIIKPHENRCFENLSHQISSIFIEILCENDRSFIYRNKKGHNRTIRLLRLKDCVKNSFVSETHMPRIIEPEVNFETYEDRIIYSKKIQNGVSTINLDKKTKKALIISQQKKYKINKNTLNLFKLIDSMEIDDVEKIEILPFVPISCIKNIVDKIEKLKEKVDDETRKKIRKEILDIKYNKDRNKVINDYSVRPEEIKKIISEKLNIEIKEIEICYEIYSLKNKLDEYMKLRKLHNTVIKFSELFEGFPIYFLESFDFRIRMYTHSYMFSRTSGIYKYFLKEFKMRKLTINGLIVMLKSFYKDYEEKNEELLKLIEEIKDLKFKEIIDELDKWNSENIDFDIKITDKTSVYKILLQKELKEIFKNNLNTSFMLEMDQKSSSTMLASIILGDIKLLKYCNLLDSEESYDVNKILMNKSEEFFKNKVCNETLEILKNTRNLHKKIFMCTTYNLTKYGTKKYLREFIPLKYYEDIEYIANNYNDFIDNCFENINSRKDLFNKVIKKYLELTKELEPLILTTLDGSLLKWYIINNKDVKSEDEDEKSPASDVRKFKDPITETNKSYRSKNNHVYKLKSDKQKMLNGFLASFIHSVDGAIMRIIILNVFKKSNYIISHLHDSIQFHPNNYEVVCEVIKELYSSEIIRNIVIDNLFKKIINNLKDSDREELEVIINEFLDESYKEVQNIKFDINVDYIYPLD